MENIILKGICKSYGGKRVLNGLDAEIKRGEVNCLMAPSGAGKTTLIRILMGLETADSGAIENLSTDEIRAVFQEDRLVSNLTAKTNIKIATDAKDEDIEKLLNDLLLTEVLKSRVATMSGGERRRVAVARALLSNSKLIIFDEPFKGLDEDTKMIVVSVVLEYTRGKTILLITHDEEEATALGVTNFIEI